MTSAENAIFEQYAFIILKSDLIFFLASTETLKLYSWSGNFMIRPDETQLDIHYVQYNATGLRSISPREFHNCVKEYRVCDLQNWLW